MTVSEIASRLRRAGVNSDYDYLQRSVKAQMREANKFNARFALFVGGEEFEQGKLNLKNMESGEQQIFPLNDINQIVNHIKA